MVGVGMPGCPRRLNSCPARPRPGSRGGWEGTRPAPSVESPALGGTPSAPSCLECHPSFKGCPRNVLYLLSHSEWLGFVPGAGERHPKAPGGGCWPGKSCCHSGWDDSSLATATFTRRHASCTEALPQARLPDPSALTQAPCQGLRHGPSVP